MVAPACVSDRTCSGIDYIRIRAREPRPEWGAQHRRAVALAAVPETRHALVCWAWLACPHATWDSIVGFSALRTFSKRSSLALDAVRAALRALAALATSDEVIKLIEQAHACEQIVEGWRDTPPTAEKREEMMRRILALNVAVAKLGRQQ